MHAELVGFYTYGFATNPEMVGEDDVSVATYNPLSIRDVRIHVILWSRSGHGWVVLPFEKVLEKDVESRNREAVSPHKV